MQQTSVFFYRFRFLFASTLVIAFLMALSAIVTALGSNTVLDAKTHTLNTTGNTIASNGPNVVTNAAYVLSDGVQHVLLSTGIGLYSTCRAISSVSASGGRAIGHTSGALVRGVGSGITAIGHGVGGGISFVVHIPIHIVGAITGMHPVSAIIRPADEKPTPTISAETSAAALANLNAQQQQAFALLQAAQVTANRQLGGTVIAGDPNHGGYPAKWDNTAQDSQLDNWGMYNRECVSYAAWKVYQTYGSMPYWGGVGNANQWVRDARNNGIATGAAPQVHSVAISMAGYYGHAMWVEKVSGTMIYVSQYNYDLHGHYSEMWVDGRSFTYIYFK